MKRVFTPNEHLNRRVLFQEIVGSQDRTDVVALVGFVFIVTEICFETDFEEGMRQNHVVQSCQQAGSVVVVH